MANRFIIPNMLSGFRKCTAFKWVSWCLICFVFALTGLRAQQSLLRHLTREEGLSEDGYNWFTFKDSRGLVWISSTDGVNVFDGRDISIFKPKPDEPEGLKGNNVQSTFFEDKEGNIWFTTYEALNCYFPKQSHFRSYSLFDAEGKLIDHDFHAFHLEKRNSWLWLVIDGNIYRFDTGNPGVFQAVGLESKGKRFAVDTTSEGKVCKIVACPWIMDTGIEWMQLEESGWQKEDIKFNRHPLLRDAKVSKAIFDPVQHCVWLASSKGLIRFDPDAPATAQHFSINGNSGAEIYDVIRMDAGQLLLALRGKGLWTFDSETHHFAAVPILLDGEPVSFTAFIPRTVYIDSDGLLWISFQGNGIGYFRLRVANKAFFEDMKAPGLHAVQFLEEDNFQNIWIAGEENQLSVFPEGGTSIRIQNGADIGPLRGNSRKFFYLFSDHQNRLWLLKGNAIFQYEAKQNKWNLLLETPHFLFSIFQMQDEKIMLTTNKGVLELKAQNDTWELVQAEFFSSFPDFNFYIIFKDRVGTLYMPFNDNSLLIASAENRVAGKVDTVPLSASIYGMAALADGRLFFGTSSGLMNLDSPRSLRAIPQGTWAAGHDPAFRPIADNKDRIWYGNQSGLWMYDPAVQQTVRFSAADGLSE